MSNKILLPLGIIAVGVAAITVLALAKPDPQPRPPEEEPAKIQVTVAETRPQAQRLSVQAHGTVLPRREIDLVAEVSGRITRVEPRFVDGGFFQADELLLQIDERDYQAALLTAQSRVAEAEQRLAEERGRARQAEREWRDLGDENANNLFMRKPQVAAAEANLASAQGALNVARLNLERTKITVPFGGRIRQTEVDLGEYVSAGTRLATVYDATAVEVRLPLTERQAALVDLPLTSRSDKPPVPVTVRGSVAGTEEQWQGHLVRTDAFVDAESRLYYAVVEVENPFAPVNSDGEPQAPLLPGLFVDAEIQGRDIEQVIQLPRSALFERSTLLVLDDENRIRKAPVTVLHKTETDVWLQSSLPARTRVSLEKQTLTPEGTEVSPVLETNEAATVAASSAQASSDGREE